MLAPMPGRSHLPAVPAVVALAGMVLHLLALGRYGYFRDELYYLASTSHLALGYVDHPPLSIGLLAAVTAVLGEGLAVIRTLSALLCAIPVLMAGEMARRLGAGAYGQGLAALATLAAPELLGSGHFYSMNVLEQALWA